ncbi:asparagine synthetase B [Bacteroidales bacterium OttesenSCG-928-B11]|nr:asparagine synthetase B [Bacteroidales bacterium OttesenSCG-928-E04]MDL2312066.1 asparagine synthetase B [Bacteroidales bacterium OttesenSCG-928-B11]MDL2325676.1 asparagine synthetase B [Bacteroidales bacterium OttesenSCG-928-A14]
MRKLKKLPILLFLMLASLPAFSSYILIPMDLSQKNHLKAYGIAFFTIQKEVEVSWLLNYRGGSFMCPFHSFVEDECVIRDVSYQVIADVQASAILAEVSSMEHNMNEIRLTKTPKIAVYSPKSKLPWDDAVTLVLTYAEIPYDIIYDEEVITGMLPKYDWLHLHHEDFTGQYGKFWGSYRNAAWYIADVKENEEMAAKLGFDKVSQMKLAVVKRIRDFVAGGGYLFAMCSGPDSFDIALAADGVDICDRMFDGDPMDPDAQSKLNYENTFAFTDFKISTNPYEYEISDIDVEPTIHLKNKKNDYFSLFEFSAKWDIVPAMLCQNHQSVIPGFMGQTTAFRKNRIKPHVLIMGETKIFEEARYIHGEYGKGTWTFYSGHDPEDYQHFVNDPPTDLNLFPNSAGYRLILNNVLFPAAKKEKQKT